jgi:hypothetical protein
MKIIYYNLQFPFADNYFLYFTASSWFEYILKKTQNHHSFINHNWKIKSSNDIHDFHFEFA